MSGTPQKRKGSANHQRNAETGKNCQKTNETQARLSAILRIFPRGEIILGVLEMSGTPQKRKWSANHQSNPETGKN